MSSPTPVKPAKKLYCYYLNSHSSDECYTPSSLTHGHSLSKVVLTIQLLMSTKTSSHQSSEKSSVIIYPDIEREILSSNSTSIYSYRPNAKISIQIAPMAYVKAKMAKNSNVPGL